MSTLSQFCLLSEQSIYSESVVKVTSFRNIFSPFLLMTTAFFSTLLNIWQIGNVDDNTPLGKISSPMIKFNKADFPALVSPANKFKIGIKKVALNVNNIFIM